MESAQFTLGIKMSFELLLSSAFSGAEELLNKALELDPASKNKLFGLSGKVFEVKCTSPEFSIFITIHEQGFLLSPFFDGNSDAKISGKASGLLELLTSSDKEKVIRSKAIKLQGDTEAIQQFQSMLFELNIDWEYHLSKLIGDIPTQTLSEGLDFLGDFLKKTGTSIQSYIDEYAHNEANLFPHDEEIESFSQRINQLRLKVDRSEARIRNFENNN